MLDSTLGCATRRRLTAGQWPIPALALAGAVFAPRSADACGALPTPTFAISAVSPSSGSSGVARDSGIVVSGVSSSASGGASSFADVALIDADTGAGVPLAAVGWFSFQGPEVTMAVHPVAPLQPQHSYRVQARPLDIDSGTPGDDAFLSQFVTSDALLEPLVLTGELGLSLRGREVDIVSSGPCGNDRAVIGKRRALLADVQLPVPRGGQGAYQAVLHFSDHTPLRVSPADPLHYAVSGAEPQHEVRLRQLASIEPGEVLTLQQEVIEEAAAYAGCFTLIVWDPAGHAVQTSRCLPSLSPEEIRTLAASDTPVDVATDDAVAAEEIQHALASDERATRGPVIGCSIQASAPSSTPAWPALLLASLLAARRARRR